MKLRLNDFRKIVDNDNSAVLQHAKHGHKVTLAKPALSLRMRGEIAAMPIHLFSGGNGKEELPAELTPQEEPMMSEQPSDQMMTQNTNAVPQEVPAANQPPPIDPKIAAIREQYNRHVVGNFDPNQQIQHIPGITFGPNGEIPNTVHPDIWSSASNDINAAGDKAEEDKKDQAAQIEEENKARTLAGAPLLPVPQGLATDTKKPTASVDQGSIAPKTDSTSLDLYKQGQGFQLTGMAGEAEAQSQAAQDKYSAAVAQEKALSDIHAKSQQNIQHVADDIDSTVKDINDSHINPNHYLEGQGTLGRIAIGIGLMVSGLGAGMSGQKNLAAEYLNQQIDRDINAQKANLGKKETVLSAYYKKYGNMIDAERAAYATQNAVYAAKIEQAAAKATSPLVKSQLLQHAGEFYQKSALNAKQIAFSLGAQSSDADPAMKIAMLAPAEKQEKLQKDYEDASNKITMRDQALKGFDLVNEAETPSKVLHSLVSGQGEQMNAGIDELAKDDVGKVNEAVRDDYRAQFKPRKSDTPFARKQRRQAYIDAWNSKIYKPSLIPYGVDTRTLGAQSPKKVIKESDHK